MKCTWCRESIRESKDGWTADGLIHCENSKNGKHEPEPTEAAPSRCNCGADRTGPSAEAHSENCPEAEREAVVVDPAKCVVHGVTLESCRKDKRTGCSMGESVVGGQPFDIRDGKHQYKPCVRCGAKFGMGMSSDSAGVFVICTACSFIGPNAKTDKQAFEAWNSLPQPETPRPEMGNGLAEKIVSTVFPSMDRECSIRYIEQIRIILAAASGTESAPEIVLLDFGKSPCGHPGQYAYTEDGGKNIICLLCERASSLTQAGPQE